MASEQDIRLAQGALFVIDNTGPCPDGKKYRTFIDAAIAHHLTRHTYYYQDRGRPGAKNTRRATARKFRNSLQALWEYVKPESRGRKGGDRAEALFTLKSEAITAEALQIYAYDPRTFSETDLPGFVDEGGDILQSREQTQTASTPAPEAQQVQASVLPPKRKLESLDEPQQHAAKRPRTEEPIADTDGNNRPFHISRSSQELASTSLMRAEEGSQSLDETQLRAAKRPRSGTPGDPTADAERDDLSSRMSRCRSCIQSKKGCDRQRPCGRCKAAGIGREGCIGEEVPGRGENQIATEKNGAASTSDVENNHSPPRSPRMPLPGPSTGSKRGLESSDEQQQNVAKRPRVDAADTPTRRKMLTIKLPRCKRCQQAHIGGCDGNMATVANETLQSDSLEATQSHDADSPYQEPQGHKIDLGMFVKQVKELQYGAEQAAHDLLACIGQIHNMPCPLDMEPSKDLEALYVRCWGAEWKAVATGLLKVGAFGNPFNTMSLISAFLFDKILNKQAYNKELAQDFIAQLQAGGPTGGAILKALDWSQRELEIAETVPTVAIEEARTTLAQDEAAVRSQQQKEAETLMKEFWNIMLPHFRTHIVIARTYGLSSGKSEDDLFELFDSVITPIIQNALHHKLQLVANGCKCAYFWPCDGEKFKGDKMKEFGAQTTNTLAAQTIFPGLDFDLPPSYDYPLHPVITSLVMTKKDPSRAQASGSDAIQKLPTFW